MKFWRTIAPADREELYAVMEAANKAIAANEALRAVVHALIETHPDPARLKLAIYPRIVAQLSTTLGFGPAHESRQKELQLVLAAIGGGDVPPPAPPAPAATDAPP